ncbi:hypothetical protein QWU11_45075 [Actinomadura sp. DC4]|nr:hypothetical protein [Actinomadura sp. DC4]MDN3359814.1 hypothetical protein [Actinomadura sp. DC4]
MAPGDTPADDSCSSSSTYAATKPRAPVAVEPPTGITYGRWPRFTSVARSSSAAASSSSQASTPVKCSSAPSSESSRTLPVGAGGRAPPSTRWHARPLIAAPAATVRAWFDWAAPTVTRQSAPKSRASPSRNSSFRILLPPSATPVRSSRLSHTSAPIEAENRRAG